jgi:uncharacterized protein (DUF983 family)
MTTNQQIALSILAAIAVLGVLTLIAAYLMIGMAWQDFQSQPTSSVAPSAYALIARALARKCPVCGRGAISASLFHMNPKCSNCGAVFWSNEGEWMGPVVINYSTAVVAALATWAILMMFDFSAIAQILLPSIAAVVIALAITPWSHSFWTVFLYLTGEIRPNQPSPIDLSVTRTPE